MPINLEGVGTIVEGYMLSTCRVTRVTGQVFNPVTMQTTDTIVMVYEGKCFMVPMGDPAGTTYGGEAVYRAQYELALPRTAAPMKPNDRVEMLTATDASLVGPGYFVHDIIRSTFFTHRRVKAFRDVVAT